MQRRTFLTASLAALAHPLLRAATSRPKSILVLGGTHFLGPAFIEGAIADGHTVTLFNRGVTNPEFFPYVEKLRGFRSATPTDENLSALGTRRWDIVIDIWPHDPAIAESAARFLKDRTTHYLYVSSISAYDSADFSQPNVQENANLSIWTSSDSPYSRGKAETERRLHQIIGERLTIVRPGPIKGIRDDTPDILAWLRRLQAGTPVIAPGDGSDPVQIVDVKDVADFLLLAIDRSIFGTFNLTGRSMPYREFLDQCRSAVHSNAELVWIPEAFLRQQMPDANLPNWRFFSYWRIDTMRPNFSRISSQKAYDAGWLTRPLRYTAIDYLAWVNAIPTGDPAYGFKDPLTPDRQESLITEWRKSRS